MKKENITQIFWIIWTALWILFALFIAYQILVKVFGGSWISEALTIALLSANLITTIQLIQKTARIESDVHHLSRKVDEIDQNLKEHIKESKH